ncbi:LuxR C-terminal-related transcriptional regulator [Azospirillum sp. sgz302134]
MQSSFESGAAIPPPFGHPPFGTWNEAVGRVVEATGTPDFPRALEAALGLLAPFQMMNGFHYSPDGRAFDLCNDRISADRGIIVDQYLAGAYVLDPFYDATRLPGAERLITMRQLAPDSFEQSEYFRVHYAATGIVDEIGFRLALQGGHAAVLSLSRIGGEAALFSADELERLRAAAALVCALGERHWGSVPASADTAAQDGTPRRFEHPLLTRREQEIVTLILKGHSSLSIAAVLSLSPDTVKVHRRRIYAKLKISSQGELFRTFLADHLADRLTTAGPA